MLSLILATALWGIVHSLLASTAFNNWFGRTLGNRSTRFYRLFYNVFAVISFLPMIYLMLTLPDRPLYQVPAPFNFIMRVGQLVSVIFLFVILTQTDLLSFVGLRQLFEDRKDGGLVTTGLYRYVRHPLYTFTLSFFWLSPTMSLNSFIVYAALTLYVLIGIVFEERKLVRTFGQEYEEYRSVTPTLIPGLHVRWNKQSR